VHPGFPHQDLRLARLFVYHRSLCIYSHHYRGTPEKPGLVLGLRRGGSCRSLAFHVPGNEAQKTYDYLVEREQINGTYQEKHVCLHLEDGKKVQSLVFVTDSAHPQYAGTLAVCDIAKIVSTARGKTGSNQDYVLNTLQQLRMLKIYDRLLERVAHGSFHNGIFTASGGRGTVIAGVSSGNKERPAQQHRHNHCRQNGGCTRKQNTVKSMTILRRP